MGPDSAISLCLTTKVAHRRHFSKTRDPGSIPAASTIRLAPAALAHGRPAHRESNGALSERSESEDPRHDPPRSSEHSRDPESLWSEDVQSV